MQARTKTLLTKGVTYAPLIGAICTFVYGGITTWVDVGQAKEDQKELKHFIKEYDKDLDKIFGQFNLVQQEIGGMKAEILNLKESEAKTFDDFIAELNNLETAAGHIEDDVDALSDNVNVIQKNVFSGGQVQDMMPPQPQSGSSGMPFSQQTQQSLSPIQRKGYHEIKADFMQKK